MHTAIIAITAQGARLGERLHREISGSGLFVLEKYASSEATPFAAPLQALVERLWPEFGGFVFVMASGIVVRTVAPLLRGKDRDPAVVVMDDAGRFAISLVSGHLGGANELAARCAAVTGAQPVITTATDANGLPSFDLLAQDMGWEIEDLSRVKHLNGLLLDGKEIAVVDWRDEVRGYCDGRGNLSFNGSVEEAVAGGAEGFLFVTNRVLIDGADSRPVLTLRPRNICLGIGCNRGTPKEEIAAIVSEQLRGLSLSRKSIRCIATASAKENEGGLVAYAAEIGVPVLSFTSERLNAVDTPTPPSEYALAAIGARGVAEPAALLASEAGKLLLNKIRSGNVTVAIAEDSPDPIPTPAAGAST